MSRHNWYNQRHGSLTPGIGYLIVTRTRRTSSLSFFFFKLMLWWRQLSLQHHFEYSPSKAQYLWKLLFILYLHLRWRPQCYISKTRNDCRNSHTTSTSVKEVTKSSSVIIQDCWSSLKFMLLLSGGNRTLRCYSGERVAVTFSQQLKLCWCVLL